MLTRGSSSPGRGACPSAPVDILTWSLGRCQRACRRGGGGLLRGSVGFAAPVLAADLRAGAAGGAEDQPGGRFGGLVLDRRQDGGVRVGGQDDAGVTELILNLF